MLMAVLAFALAGLAPVPDEVHRADEFLKLMKGTHLSEKSDRDVNDFVQNQYTSFRLSSGAGSDLSTASADDLHTLFEAFDHASFYTSGTDATVDLLTVAEELSRRKLLTDVQARHVAGSLQAARLFTQAEFFAIRHGLETPPSVSVPEVAAAPVLLDPDPAGARFAGRTFALPAGGYVLAVGNPTCHFTVNAIAAMDASPTMASALHGRMQWVVPQQRGGWREVADWNREHPTDPMAVAYLWPQWPMIDTWETPTFYFFRDRHLVAKVTGWPKEGNMASVMDAARKAGLMPPR